MTANQLFSIISTFQYISFDIFDTLLYRTFRHYTDVFDVVELLYNDSEKQRLSQFRLQRVLAERNARKKRTGKEITLDMIYENLDYDENVKWKLKEIEKYVEISNCVPNHVMTDILARCKAQGKTIVITTDMYLPREVFEKILDKIGVAYDYLFISGEEGVTKRSGKLFPVVLKKLGISASDIAHIGDDLNNDIAMPAKYGIAAFERIQNNPMELPYSLKAKDIYTSHIDSFLRLGLQRYSNSPEVILGYTILGPMMWEFCEWIHKIKEEEHLEKLLFVAREGWLIMRCYKEMYPEDNDIVSYIRLNKNLLRLPSLKHGDRVAKFIRSIPGRSKFTWTDILKYLGVEDIEYFISHLSKHFPESNLKSGFSNKELRQSKDISSIIEYAISLQEGVINNQYDMLLEYLTANGITSQRIGLVNNSINGSGQSLVEEFLAENGITSNIFGIQFVRSKRCVNLLAERSAGWINDHRKASFKTTRFVSLCLLLEHLMFEPQGTALRFNRTVDGGIEVCCEFPRTEVQDFSKIEDVQKYALSFISDFKNHIPCSLNGIGYERYLKMLLNPDKREALFLGSLWDDDVEQDRQLLNLDAKFKLVNSLLKHMPENTSWVEGWLAINNVPSVYRYIVRLRQLIRYYRHYNPFVETYYC